MQLVVSDFEKEENNDKIIIQDKRIHHKLTRVLRIDQGDNIWIQPKYTFGKINTSQIFRYKLEITSIDSKKLIGNIINKEVQNTNNIKERGIALGVLNDFSKMDMAVRKMTEIGLNNIVFWFADRSVIPKISKKKLKRFQTIAHNALEQSKNWILPSIRIIDSIEKFILENNTIRFNMDGKDIKNLKTDQKQLYAIIGPEGGFSDREEKVFNKNNTPNYNISDSILRSETASIVGGWCLIS